MISRAEHGSGAEEMPSISVTLVTWNSADVLGRCLDSLAAQEYAPFEVIVVDNASRDGSAALAESHPIVTLVDRAGGNLGFAAGQNRAIARSRGDWVLVLNPDTRLSTGFLQALAGHASAAQVGTLCGKLLRMDREGNGLIPPRIDSAGMEMRRSFRHFDRGAGEVDSGQFENAEAVFGATGAAALYRRTMIADVSIDGEFFDSAFFAYREDADLAWRAQILGWDCHYVPDAVGFHVRRVVPERRAELAPELNRYSVRNRFLMRGKNADSATWRHAGWRGLGRDLLVVAGCLLRERSSLPGLYEAWNARPRLRAQHKWIEAHRRRSPREVLAWFR